MIAKKLLDEVEFNEDGLVIYVTNIGNERLWLAASSPDDRLEHTLMKKQANEWVKVPQLEGLFLFADALEAQSGETYAVLVNWDFWYGGRPESGTYRLTSKYWSFEDDGSSVEHTFEMMFGLRTFEWRDDVWGIYKS